jgi:hypothetical protein
MSDQSDKIEDAFTLAAALVSDRVRAPFPVADRRTSPSAAMPSPTTHAMYVTVADFEPVPLGATVVSAADMAEALAQADETVSAFLERMRGVK